MPTMKRHGFTIIELVIVVAIMSVIAAIAIPRITAARGKAQTAAMKSDLRNLVTHEESAFADSLKYTTTPVNYAVTSGNRMPAITLTPDGWSASLTDARGTQLCAVYVGSTPLAPATKEGVPMCGPVATTTIPGP